MIRSIKRRWTDTLFGSLVSLLVAFPLLWLILNSLKTKGETIAYPPTLFPSTPTLQNYETLFQVTNFLVYFRNSVVVAVSSSVIAIVVAVLGVYSLSRFKVRGGEVIAFLLVIGYMMPKVFLAIPFVRLWGTVGLANTLLALSISLISVTLPFCVWMLRSYVETIPVSLEEAAMVDGCTRFQAFSRIVLPVASPGIAATFIFCFILAWNDYLLALVLISTETLKTITLGLAALTGGKALWSWGVLSAAAVLATAPVLVFFVFVQKRMISGFTAGAVKG